MQVGFIGLGRMGLAMVERLRQGNHNVVVYDPAQEQVTAAQQKGAQPAISPAHLVEQLDAPRTLWIMVPAGDPVSDVLKQVTHHLQKGDVILDGGNSNYKDSIERAEKFRQIGVEFLDAGTSGGIWGLKEGYCLMVGGSVKAFEQAEPLFASLAPDNGYAHVGPSGAGHFTKMVHNAMEYGMMQAYGEGFELLQRSQFPLDLHQIARLWNHGSVVRSWLLELTERALAQDATLQDVKGYVEDSGEGRWSVIESINQGVPMPVTALSLYARFLSRQDESFSNKVIAALRREFGGHAVKKQ